MHAISIRGASASSEVEGEIKGFRLAFSSPIGSEVVDVENGPVGGNIRMVNTSIPLDVPDSGEVKTYVYQSAEAFENVEIAPRLKSDKLCEVSDKIKIGGNPCGSSLVLEIA